MPNPTISVLTLLYRLRRENYSDPNAPSRLDLAWDVKIHGLIYSKCEKFTKEFPYFAGCKEGIKRGTINASKATILKSGQTIEGLLEEFESESAPIQLVTKYLNCLVDMGFKIVASSTASNDSGKMKEFLWTLQVV